MNGKVDHHYFTELERKIIMDKLIKILESVKPGVDYQKEEHLVTDGILTSFDIVTLVANLTDAYGIDITVTDLVPENFESAQAILKMVENKED
jgi:D-alanine--poly(phosphoribitol) ligase subunit 2